jgi:hypothetical protein
VEPAEGGHQQVGTLLMVTFGQNIRLKVAVRRAALPAVCLLLTLAVLTPLLGRGFVLSYDMVFAPRQFLVPGALGLGSALPRSVPADAVVALATMVAAGDIVQKLVLFLALFAGALGAGRLVPTASTGTRIVAAISYGWSAYLAERLFIGHWPVLLAYSCLPWIALAGLAMRRGEPKALPRLILTMAPAVLTPTGGILAAATGLACAGWRRAAPVAGVAAVLNAPWWVPSLLHPGGSLSAPAGVGAFVARQESWGSPVLSLLGTGGIWNAEVTPASRGNPVVPLLTLAIVAIALLGLGVLARRWGAAPARALVLLGAFGVALAALGSLPIGQDVLRWLTEQVPGAGLLRDSQKWVAWWALPLAVGFALAVEAGAARLRTHGGRVTLVAAAAALPVVIMPDLAWGGWGRLATVDYPSDWAEVRSVLATDERPGDVLAVPLSAFRRFAWNNHRTQLDPAPRVLPRTTLIDDRLVVGGVPVPGEDRRMAAIRTALADRGDLGRLGIGWVLVEHGTPGAMDAAWLAGLEEVRAGPWLSLYRVPDEIGRAPEPDGAPVAPVLTSDVAALVLVALALLWRALPTGRLSHLTPRDRACRGVEP